MSYSSLYGIREDFTGEDLREYHNSWLFSPMVWDVLPEKYIPAELETIYGYRAIILGNDALWRKTNNALNQSDDTADRICWEMTHQQIFSTKDKQLVADSIRKFVEQNKGYGNCGLNDHLKPLEREYVMERFTRIAEDILALDETEHPYFVFKNTSVDDNVENWFWEYDDEADEYIERSMKDAPDVYSDFVIIEGGEITGWMRPSDFINAKLEATDAVCDS